MFGQKLTVEIQFVWYLTTNNRLERMDSQKIVNYRTKSVIKQYISYAETHWMLLYDLF